MANEIYHDYDSASTLYAFVYRQSDGYIYDVGDTAFEAIGTWNDARADQCDIAMTASGDFHMGAFPAVAAGTYYVVIRDQAGANAAIADTPRKSYRLGVGRGGRCYGLHAVCRYCIRRNLSEDHS